MAKRYNGQIHVRIPPELHEEMARESFETGTPIGGICAQALMARRVLGKIEPWKSVETTWEANERTDLRQLEEDVNEAIRASRKKG
jgi:hypothetical protein